jgi:hypothetical protein
MEVGYYRKRPIDWSLYTVDLFVPHLYTNHHGGCGANTLSLLTGVPPAFIQNTNKKNPNHWKDSFMVNFLRKRGFKVLSLTKCEATNNVNGIYVSDSINNRHVLLLSQLMSKNTASWTVVHNELLYHNFEIISFKGLNLINSPSLTVYVVFNPKWKSENWKHNENYKKSKSSNR